ncbi:hypothetical protein [Candidatus Arsenophonus triatominarum]|uniref:hypothetical protein n=1 Tax=Candidatus Arsenophonus triatominarum TaxID=57911 RepID=UPI0007C46555|nr:hypothetical protein [Candidatus Arsenophonus triatominarum]
MDQEKHIARSNLPKGIASKNPIPMRLFVDERKELEAIAVKESRSISAMARLIFLIGLKYFSEQEK